MITIRHILLLASFCIWNPCHGIKILRNTLDIHVPDPVGGAKLINAQKGLSGVQDLTICLRFRLKILGTYEGRASLLQIEDWRAGEEIEPDFRCLRASGLIKPSYYFF